jgi:hypothetical protein
MKSHTYYHWFDTGKKREYIRITDLVEEQLAVSGIKEGFCLVSSAISRSGCRSWLPKAPITVTTEPARPTATHI